VSRQLAVHESVDELLRDDAGRARHNLAETADELPLFIMTKS